MYWRPNVRMPRLTLTRLANLPRLPPLLRILQEGVGHGPVDNQTTSSQLLTRRPPLDRVRDARDPLARHLGCESRSRPAHHRE
jgi:hypothetical protein